MEENIKILEGYLDRNTQLFEDYGENAIIQDKEIQALENLIKGYRELEKENEHYKKYSVMMSTEGLLINGVKFSFNEFIPVSKVKEKIEEDAFEVYTRECGNIEVVCTDSLYELMEDK